MISSAAHDLLLSLGQPVLEDGDAARGIAAALYGAIVPVAIHAVRFEERVERSAGTSEYVPAEDDDVDAFYILIGDMRRVLRATLAYHLLANGWTYAVLPKGYEEQEAGVWRGPAGEEFTVLTDGVQVPVVSCELQHHVLQALKPSAGVQS
ncbi:MAG: hypothetical protein ACJ74Q_15475 [Pyrinomonadaceae bacterium]